MAEDLGSKSIVWLASTKRDLKGLPDEVQDRFGYALWIAQIGRTHPSAKALAGFGDASVIEVVEDWQGNAYRAVYTVRFEEFLYVLHVFQKKSHRGARTPKADVEVIRERLKAAKAIHKALGKKDKRHG